MVSFIRKALEYVSLLSYRESAAELVKNPEFEAKQVKRHDEFFQEQTQVFKEQRGLVTQKDNDSIELNHRFIYQLVHDRDNFEVNDLVSWKVYETSNGVEIKDVILVNDRDKLVEKEIFSAKIVEINYPKYTTNCGAIFYLDKVRCELGFRPVLGDFIKLEGIYIKDEADTGEFDVDPERLQVTRVTPDENKLVTGKITHWDTSTSSGVVKSDVFFHQDICGQLVPVLGASVVCNCVKGEYANGFRWRAYEMKQNCALLSTKPRFFNVDFIPPFDVVLGETKIVELCVTNNKERPCNVEKLEFFIGNEEIQMSHGLNLPYPILADIPAYFPIEVKGNRLGEFKVTLKWYISNLRHPISSKLVYRTVQQYLAQPAAESAVRRRAPLVVPGRRRMHNPVYRKVPMREYPVPQRLREICTDEKRLDLIEIQIILNQEYPFLGECFLSPANYGDHMHTMMYIEEIFEEKVYEKLATRGSLLRAKDCVTFSFPADSEYTKVVVGDKVRASKPWEKVEYEALVTAINATSISLSFNEGFENSFPSGAQFDLRFLLNRNTNKRRHQAIDLVLKSFGPDWLLPNEHAVVDKDTDTPIINRWYNEQLNREQKSAVLNILAKKNLPYPYIIYGPPGTGKTVTVVESILQMITHQSDFRILVTAPTNSAVDSLGLRLLGFKVFDKIDMVRLSSYNAYSSGQIAAQLVDITMVPNLGDPAHDRPLSQDDDHTPVLSLEHLGNYRIIIGTLSTVSLLNCAGIPKGFFTHIIIDEAGQCHEPDTLLPIALAQPNKTQLVLAGDPQQLGPLISSLVANQYGFNQSFLDRLTKAYLYRKSTDAFRETHGYNPVLITKLVNNYRSLPKIVDLVGSLFYGGDLRPTISAEHSREADVLRKIIIHREELKTKMISMIFINVNTPEEQVEGNMSWMNHGEVAQVFYLLNFLYNANVSADDIGVITPYALQKKKIYEYLDSVGAISPKVASVEEFQGQERDVIILSLVRNNLGNSKRLSSFVTDSHRVNVAMSRARVLNVIIGNLNTMKADQLWARIISKCHIINLATANRLPRDENIQPVTSFPDPD